MRGVDRIAGKWARDHGVLEWDFLPLWHRVNEHDGLTRNQSRTGLRRHGRLNRLSAGSPREKDGFDPEIRFAVLPSAQSETPVQPKSHLET